MAMSDERSRYVSHRARTKTGVSLKNVKKSSKSTRESANNSNLLSTVPDEARESREERPGSDRHLYEREAIEEHCKPPSFRKGRPFMKKDIHPLPLKIALLAAAPLLFPLPGAHAFISQPARSLLPKPHTLVPNPSTFDPFGKATTVPSPNNNIARTPSSSALSAIPSTVVSAIGHVLGGNLATPFVIGAVKTWYAKIPLPSWCPPNGIFGPTWVLLYSMIGVAAARVAALQGSWKSPTMLFWGAHYALNLTWAPLFFGMAKLRAACVVNALMVASMPWIIYQFAAVDPTAALLLLPYTAWITFATVLNVAICKLNPMDGKGYSEAKLQAGIAKLQQEAAKNVGL